MMPKLLLGVALGGALGSLVRFGVTRWLSHHNPHQAFSVGVLLANLAGCFLIGFIFTRLSGLEPVAKEALTAFLVTGFLGGLTTYSTYALEVSRMAHQGAWKWAGLYFVLHLGGGVAAVFSGIAAAGRFGSPGA